MVLRRHHGIKANNPTQQTLKAYFPSAPSIARNQYTKQQKASIYAGFLSTLTVR